jgi:hypothetical protein
MKVVILDFDSGEVDIVFVNSDETEEIESILAEDYGYSLYNINYMAVKEVKINVK